MSDRDFSQRAAKGQAYNLAVLTAIADGKHHDSEYVTKMFLKHLQFASVLQKADPNQLADITRNHKLLELVKEMDKVLGE